MYKIEFTVITEVRMGSPYLITKAHLSGTKGEFIPDLSGKSFYDKAVIDQIKDICYIIAWDAPVKGEPFFFVVRISSEEKSIKRSHKIEGFCDEISLVENGVEVTTWQYKKGNKKVLVTHFYNFASWTDEKNSTF